MISHASALSCCLDGSQEISQMSIIPSVPLVPISQGQQRLQRSRFRLSDHIHGQSYVFSGHAVCIARDGFTLDRRGLRG